MKIRKNVFSEVGSVWNRKSFAILLALCCSSNAIYLDCDYAIRAFGVIGNLYTCTAGFLPSTGNKDVLDVSHNHPDGWNNSDVKALVINQTIAFTPRNIHSFFPNLVIFSIYNRNTSELTKESLKGLSHLRRFDFGFNNLRIIEEDLFIDNPLIEWLYFESNPIRHVAFDAFDNLQYLSSLHMNNTTCINEFASNPIDLDILKFRIIVKCPPTFEMLEAKIVNGSLLQNVIAARIESEIDPIRKTLTTIEEEQRILLARVDVLERNGTHY